MREILFRGKRNGEWFEGMAFFKNGNCYLIQDVFQCDEYFCIGTKNVEVIPKTVGQYTGLNDKNGTKIFEGDIVKSVALSDSHSQRGTTRTLIVENFMGNSCLRFIGSGHTGVTLYPLIVDHVIEVIGNIHDNPGLLKGDCDNA